MRNLKFIVTGVMVTAILVAGGVCLKNMFSKKEVNEEEIVTSEFIQNKSMDESKKEEAKVVTVQTEPLTIVSQEKKYFEEWKTENYEIVVKNTSGGYIRKISFTLGEGIYELYNLNPGESYKFVAFNTETDINLKVMSIV
jgi:predicted double-glycine peptidase